MDHIVNLFSRSKVVIDLPNPLNEGLTMRSFEVLGSGLKLITTNNNILNEPFYNPEYICVVNPEEINIELNFIKDGNSIPFSSIASYSLKNWLINIFA
jgi:hypothetical protein